MIDCDFRKWHYRLLFSGTTSLSDSSACESLTAIPAPRDVSPEPSDLSSSTILHANCRPQETFSRIVSTLGVPLALFLEESFVATDIFFEVENLKQ